MYKNINLPDKPSELIRVALVILLKQRQEFHRTNKGRDFSRPFFMPEFRARHVTGSS